MALVGLILWCYNGRFGLKTQIGILHTSRLTQLCNSNMLDGKPASIVFVCVRERRVYDSIGEFIIFYRFRSTSL